MSETCYILDGDCNVSAESRDTVYIALICRISRGSFVPSPPYKFSTKNLNTIEITITAKEPGPCVTQVPQNLALLEACLSNYLKHNPVEHLAAFEI
jgi:hypothetical protein